MLKFEFQKWSQVKYNYMNVKLLKVALLWLILALALPLLALSFTAGVASAGCPCEGGGTPPPTPPVTKTICVDVSPGGAGDVEVERQLPYSYPFTRTVVQDENVYLEALPADGYYFVGWGGDLSGSESPIYVRIIEDTNITAHFFPEEIVSEDNVLRVVFPAGTVVRDGDGNPLAGLEIAINETPLLPPPEADIVGLPYELGPHGATFDQLVSLSFSYDPSQIPPRIAEEELVMGYYDDEAEEWLVLPSVVDMANDTITASIDHLSTFAVIAPNPPPLPADFAISALNVSPLEADIGETVTVSVLVTNTGELAGSYTLNLRLDGAAVETREITMAGGSQTATFTTSRDKAGTYAVEVNGLEGSFTVLEAPLLPLALPSAVIWTILGLAIAALVVSAIIVPIVSVR